MSKAQTVYINFTGGIVSPGYLKEVLQIASAARATGVRFGLRQQMILDIPAAYFDTFKRDCTHNNIRYEYGNDAVPNIVSSYPAASIFSTDSWLREGVYKDIFDLINYIPTLKINICDSTQSLVPFFTGHINWISSTSMHFWYLYIRFPKTGTIYCWPDLVYTNEIAVVSRCVEEVIVNNAASLYVNKEIDGLQLYQQVKSRCTYVSKKKDEELKLPFFSLPYYEGLNGSENALWLGIYRRDELFPVSFLTDICTLCTETKIGQLYTTPWKSIIIKGIERGHTELWNYVLGQYRINVRHAANELNWQVEENSEEGLMLKRHIIRHFDKEDVRTSGLSFAVQTIPTSSMFGSVVIRKQQISNRNRLKSLDRFDILYAKDFNPNSGDLSLFREGVEKEHLGTYLVSLCKQYYQQEKTNAALHLPVNHQPAKGTMPQATSKIVHQCKHCLTVYDEEVGDAENGIAAGTPFQNLPLSYHCPLCDAEKEDFIMVDEKALQLQMT